MAERVFLPNVFNLATNLAIVPLDTDTTKRMFYNSQFEYAYSRSWHCTRSQLMSKVTFYNIYSSKGKER